MNKKITKAFSFAIAVLVLLSTFSIGAFATNNYGFDVTCPKNFDETKGANLDEVGFFQSYYEEWAVAKDGSEYYTGNTVELYLDLPLFCTELDIEDQYDSTLLEWVEEYVEGWADVTSSSYYYMNFGGFEAVAYDVYYHYHGADENGKREEYDGLYSEIYVICGAYEITVDIDVCNADDLLAKRNEIVEIFVDSIEYDAEVMTEMIAEDKTFLTVIVILLVGGFLFGTVVVVVIIVVVVKASKKKKVQQPVYPYNNMNVPPQYYNPYGNMQNGNMQGNIPVQTPPYVQPAVNEENKENNTENLDN